MTEDLKGGLLSPRRRLEQLVSNPNCETNVASALLKVGVSHVAKIRGLNVHTGLSEFAFTRGKHFESYILRKRADGSTPLGVQMIRKGLITSEDNVDIKDLRDKSSDKARTKSIDFLQSIVRDGNQDRQVIVSGFRFITSQIQPPGDVEVDLLLFTYDPTKQVWLIRIGEVKVYPDRAGFTDPNQLATARAQAGLYRFLLTKFIGALELEDTLTVADRCFFVFTKATGAGVSIWANEDISEQDERAANALRLMREKFSNDSIVALSQEGTSQDKIVNFLANHTETSYNENCWSFCELAENCLRQLISKDDALILGREVKQELGDIPIERMLSVMFEGAEPNEVEADLLARLEDAKFMKEEQ